MHHRDCVKERHHNSAVNHYMEACGRETSAKKVWAGILRSPTKTRYINQKSRLLHYRKSLSALLGHPSVDVAVKAVAGRERVSILAFPAQHSTLRLVLRSRTPSQQSCYSPGKMTWTYLCMHHEERERAGLQCLYQRSVVSLTSGKSCGRLVLVMSSCYRADPEMRTRGSLLT